MWVLKLKVESKNQFLGSLAVKHQVSVVAYVLSTYKTKNNLVLTSSGFILGDEKNKKAAIRDLKKNRKVIGLESNNDFGVLIFKEPLYTEVIWNHRIIQLSPIIIDCKEKKHLWHFGSFERKPLEKVIDFAEKYLGAEFLSFKEEKVSNISFTRLLPNLTVKQKRALEIAINNGYYNVPRRVTINKLAKLMGISFSTFQVHLRKAEEKIIPYMFKKF
ncbi:MAG: helix-turn-helix domain-containing protein [archaeon]